MSGNGVDVVDEWTRKFHTGPFDEYGSIHFFNEKQLKDYFKDFEIIEIAEISKRLLLPENSFSTSEYNIVARKN